MAIIGIQRAEFEATLKSVLSPTTPIRSPEQLKGREKKLEDIRRALVQPGRHIFIYGDRGVGKTSLAQTAAYEHQSSSRPPILLACDPSTSFYRLVQDLASRLLNMDPTILRKTAQKKGGASWVFSAEVQQSIEHGQIPDLRTMNEAVAVTAYVAKLHSPQPVAIIDEFERVQDPNERTLFADFIKQIGDQSINLKLLFCGVGSALDELLDAHHSCYRYLSAVQLERLGYQPRLEIIDAAANALGIVVEDTSRYRIAAISDGFPNYIHLITEKLLWEVFDDDNEIQKTTPDHYVRAVKAAVLDIEPRLRAIYEKASLKYTDEYEAVLWAVADHHELKRRSTDIYESYRRLMDSRGLEPMAREKFNTRMNLLKKPTHASILKGTRQGWYEFSEAVVRGYVRLRAEVRGVQLGIDHPLEYRAPTLWWTRDDCASP